MSYVVNITKRILTKMPLIRDNVYFDVMMLMTGLLNVFNVFNLNYVGQGAIEGPCIYFQTLLALATVELYQCYQ